MYLGRGNREAAPLFMPIQGILRSPMYLCTHVRMSKKHVYLCLKRLDESVEGSEDGLMEGIADIR